MCGEKSNSGRHNYLILNIYVILKNGTLHANKDFRIRRGEKKRLKEEKDGDHCLGDRYYGSFHRIFQLPADIVQEKIEATFKKGVLRISIPKEEQSKIKKIAIKS